MDHPCFFSLTHRLPERRQLVDGQRPTLFLRLRPSSAAFVSRFASLDIEPSYTRAVT